MIPHFPVNTAPDHARRGRGGGAGGHSRYTEAVFRDMWEDAWKMDDPEVIEAVLTQPGSTAAARWPESRSRR